MSDTGFPRGDGIPASAGGGAPTGPAGGDLAGTYPDPTIGLLAVTAAKIANATITDAQVAPANKDGLAAVASLRTLGTGAQQATAGNDARVVGALQAANNLSDLTNVVTARASLGLGSAATQPSGAFDPAGAAAAVTAASIGALLASNNLSDITNAATARSNLGAATDILVVHLAGIETVTGVKTFSSGIVLGAAIAMGGFGITGMANPTLPQDAATKAYVDSLVPAAYTAGTGLTLTGTQFAIDATVATLTGTQTLTNKTLTAPTINAATLSGILAGTPTFSGNITFGASIIGGTLGPTSGQQHTVPTVTSDTFALVAATQTLTNKTLTAPTINAATLSGVLAGDHTVSGVATFTAAPVVSIDNATADNVTDVASFVHTTSGTPAVGIAAGLALRAENASNIVASAARVSGRLTVLTNGAESGALDLWVNVAGTMTRRASMSPEGGLSIAASQPLALSGIGLPRDIPLYGGNAANNGWLALVQTFGGIRVEVGSLSVPTRIVGGGYGCEIYTAGTIYFYGGAGAVQFGRFDDVSARWGNGDLSASPALFMHRGSNASGTNIAGAVLSIVAGLPTGNAAANYLSLQGSVPVASGASQHTAGESVRVYGQYFRTTAGIARKKSNVADTAYTVLATDHVIAYTSITAARAVTLLAPGSGGATATSPRFYTVKDESGSCSVTNTITLSVSGGANIDGAATLVINSAYGKVTIYDNGTAYFVS